MEIMAIVFQIISVGLLFRGWGRGWAIAFNDAVGTH